MASHITVGSLIPSWSCPEIEHSIVTEYISQIEIIGVPAHNLEAYPQSVLTLAEELNADQPPCCDWRRLQTLSAVTSGAFVVAFFCTVLGSLLALKRRTNSSIVASSYLKKQRHAHVRGAPHFQHSLLHFRERSALRLSSKKCLHARSEL